jgi:hypothetical protein
MRNNGMLLLALYKELGWKGLFINFLPLLGTLVIVVMVVIWATKPSSWGFVAVMLAAVLINLFTPSHRKKYLQKRGIETRED